MGKFFLIGGIALVIAFFFVTPTFAFHLGPIVFGQERTELMAFCISLDEAMFIAKQEQESLAAGESVEQFGQRIKSVKTCATETIRYTPLKSISQWDGRGIIDGKVQNTRITLLEGLMGGITIYLFSLDQAPPPGAVPT